MKKNIIERCEKVVSSLKQEIQELKEQYEENQREIAFLSRTNIKKTLASFNVKSIGDDSTNMKTVKAKLAQCEHEVQIFKMVTGIELTKYQKKIVSNTERGIVCVHKLAGQCRFLPFEVEFIALETQTERCMVIHINIHMDCKKSSDLINLISRTKKSCYLLGFFRSLSTFTEWCEYRQGTFSQFKEKYPLAVGLPMGSSADYMVLMNSALPGCELILVWKITLNEDGSVTPVLDLLPKIPEQAMALDTTGVVENVAVNFKTLLQVFGLQATIENIIQSFCMKKGSN